MGRASRHRVVDVERWICEECQPWISTMVADDLFIDQSMDLLILIGNETVDGSGYPWDKVN